MDTQTAPSEERPVRTPPAMDVVAPPTRSDVPVAPANPPHPVTSAQTQLKPGAQPVKHTGNHLVLTVISVLLIVAALAALATFAYLSQ